MIETVHIWTDNPIYCHKLQKVLNADLQHLRNECQSCPFYHGSAQGQGVENVYYDGTNEAQVQNPDPYELERKMKSIPESLMQKAASVAMRRVKSLNLVNALKAIVSTDYKVSKDGVYKGRLVFAPDVAVSLSTKDGALTDQVAAMMVNPVQWNGKNNPPGSDDYPQAVIASLHRLGYDLEQV